MSAPTRKTQSKPPPTPAPSKITLSGVTFTADEIISAVVKIDGREIIIDKKIDDPKRIGFTK